MSFPPPLGTNAGSHHWAESVGPATEHPHVDRRAPPDGGLSMRLRRFVLGLLGVAMAATAVAAPLFPEGGAAVRGETTLIDPLDPMTDVTAKLRAVPPEGPESGEGSWYVIDLANQGGEPVRRILLFEGERLPGAGIFVQATPPQLRQIISSDENMPIEPLASHRVPAVELELPPGAPVSIALEVVNPSPAMGVTIWDPAALGQVELRQAVFEGIMIGLLVCVTCWLIGLYILTATAALAPPVVFVAFALVFIFSAFGGFAELSLWGAVTATSMHNFLLAGLCASGAAFLRSFLVLDMRWRLADAALRIVMLTFAGLAAFAFFGALWADAVVRAAAVVFALAGAVLVLWYALQGLREARILAAPAGLMALSATVAAGSALFSLGLGWLPFEPILHGGFVMGAVLAGFAAAAERRFLRVPAKGEPRAPQPYAPAPAAVARNEAAVEREQRYALGLAAAHQALWDWNVKEDRLYLSPSGEAMLGLPVGAMRGPEALFEERVHPDDREVYRSAIDTYRAQGNVAFSLECRLRHEDGVWRWFQLRASCLAGPNGQAERCIGVLSDVTVRKQLEARVAHDAVHDPLTGLPNRALFMDHLAREIRRFDPRDKRPGALLVLDIDRFKTVNDSLGHAGGDALLIAVARRLEQAFSGDETVARLGGDEFAVLIPGAPAGAAPEEAAAYILDVLAQPVEVQGREIFPRASVGVAHIESGHEFAEDMLRDAEIAMYHAKRGGRGRYAVYEDVMRASTDVVELDTGLRRAIERGEIELLYQPVMTLADGRIAGFEALIRWRHPERGVLTPDEFLPHAEETGLIVALGEYVLQEAAQQLVLWQRFFPLKNPLFMSVNVSARQLLRPEFLTAVDAALKAVRPAPGSLKLEVTEHVLMEDPEAAARALARLKELGAGLAIDDFGVGFSSLSYLQRFPFDTIKVDRSFVSGIAGEGENPVIVSSIIGLAHDLKMAVVAEGVESEADVERLKALGCEYAQGYLFGVPMTADAAQNFIAMYWTD